MKFIFNTNRYYLESYDISVSVTDNNVKIFKSLRAILHLWLYNESINEMFIEQFLMILVQLINFQMNYEFKEIGKLQNI